MNNNNKTKIVIIDSGVSLLHNRIKKNKVDGIGIDYNKNNFIVTNDIEDQADHGTGIYSIIYNHNQDAEFFIVRICKKEQDINMDSLIFALNYIHDNVNCNIINISLSITYYDDEKALREIEKICNKLFKKGVIIVAAFDNKGAISYPAAFNSVVGVTTGERCIKNTDIEFVKNNMVNVCGKGNLQSVISNSGKIVQGEGNSLACAHVTGIISKFYSQGMKPPNILKNIEKMSILTHNIPKTNISEEVPLYKYKRAILLTFGKEMHSLIRFQEMLSFEIVGVYDVRQTGMIGKSTNKELDIYNDNDFIIKCIAKTDFSAFDTVIVGHISKLLYYDNIKRELELFLLKCIEHKKNIYSLDDLNKFFKKILIKDYYHPKVTMENKVYAPL